MITAITWNTGKKNTELLQKAIKDLLNDHYPDIFVFQECLGAYVNEILSDSYEEVPYPGSGIDRRVRLFLKKQVFIRYSIIPELNNKLLFVHLKRISGKEEFNLTCVHFYSKLNGTQREQMWKNSSIHDLINYLEEFRSNNNKTMMIGDFNYNPYETDLSDPHLFNAYNCRIVIDNMLHSLNEEDENKTWYNPMWNFLGDHNFIVNDRHETSGSFYLYNKGEVPLWNLFDGVLLRPGLMDSLDFYESGILTKTRNLNFIKPFTIRTDESFIDEDLPDHLPFKAAIKI